MIYLDEMLSKLTDVFNKSKDSKIGKIISIVAVQFESLQTTLDRMEEWREIDHAKGRHLDRIGEEIVGEKRVGATDEEYRLKIKTKIVANFLSSGDIESINKLLGIYLGEYYVGAQEGWSLKGSPFDGEPAMLFVTVKGDNNPYGIPFSYLKNVGAGGISTQWQYLLERELTASNEYERYIYPFENFAGHMIAGGHQVTNDNASYISNIELSNSYSTQLNDYLICGDYVAGKNDNREYNSDFEISRGYSTLLQEYPICGAFVAGEVI